MKTQQPSFQHIPKSLPAKIATFLGGTIRKVDRFGYPISMTYENEQTYKSIFGGTMRILSLVSIITYLSINVHSAITRGEFKSTYAHRIRNVYNENTVIPLTKQILT